MMSLSDDKHVDAFKTTSRYLDGILSINDIYFDNIVSQIYPAELQLNKTNTSDTEISFLNLHLTISNDIVSTKIYDKREDIEFEIVKMVSGDVPRCLYFSTHHAGASSHVADFNKHNKLLTQKVLKQGYQYHKPHNFFSKFYR